MSEDWLTKIKEMKKKEDDMNADLEEHIEKHKDERNKIIEILISQSKKIVEIYTNESAKSHGQPKLTSTEQCVTLNIPIERPSLSQSYKITFTLALTEKGYRVDIKRGNGTGITIFPPVTLEAIQNELAGFIHNRNDEMARLISEEKKGTARTH